MDYRSQTVALQVKQPRFNSLRPSDAIWRQWSWTTLAQVMACCLTAPSHYLNQCWLIIRGVLWHTSESSFAGIAQGIDSGYEFEKDILKNIFKSPRGQWVNVATSSIQFRPEFAGPCRNSTMIFINHAVWCKAFFTSSFPSRSAPYVVQLFISVYYLCLWNRNDWLTDITSATNHHLCKYSKSN